MVFKADELERNDTKQNMTLKDQNGKDVHIQKFRDISMKASDGTRLLLLTCEHQDAIHYAMPVRSMLYDSLDYAAQVKKIARQNKKMKSYSNSAEFLSGLTKEDRLAPVIPLVFYYGDEKWDANLDLHSLLNIPGTDFKLKNYIPNYRINLVDARELAKKNCLHTDLQTILGMIEYKKDKSKLMEYIEKNRPYFQNIDADSYNAAKALLDSEIQLRNPEEKEEKIDMCKALEDLYQEGIEKGANNADERYSSLILKLSETGRTELIIQIAADSELRKQLYEEYNL